MRRPAIYATPVWHNRTHLTDTPDAWHIIMQGENTNDDILLSRADTPKEAGQRARLLGVKHQVKVFVVDLYGTPHMADQYHS